MTRGRPLGRWFTQRWARRSIRARLLVLSIVPLIAALLAGTFALVVLFSAGRIRDVDRQTRSETDTLAGLVAGGQLTSPLPLPAGSPLLAQVIDADGTVLAASRSASLVLDLVSTPLDQAQRVFTVQNDPYGAIPLRVRVQPATLQGRPVHIVVAAPLNDVQDAQHAFTVVLLVVVPVLVLAIGALEWLVIGFTLRPVDRLRAAAGQLAADAGGRRDGRAGPRPRPPTLLPVGSGDDEITRLARTLNALLNRLQTAALQQRDFVSDAAHELRSPLASMRVQLDVAQAHADLLTVGQLADELSAEVDRLSRLTDDLLLLGRLDADGPGRFVTVDLRALAGSPGPAVPVAGNRDMLARVLRNLVDNAHQHATSVQVTVATEQGYAVLDVDDDGPGIAVEDRQRVFDRWTRLDQARARSSGGSGLGLAITRDITDAHGGTVTVLDSPLGGTRLRVSLPLAVTST